MSESGKPPGAGEEKTLIRPTDEAETLIRDETGEQRTEIDEARLVDQPSTLIRQPNKTRPVAPTRPAKASQASGIMPPSTTSDWGRPDLWEDKHGGVIGPGTVVKDRFLIEERLGVGGMGIVFKARDRRKEEARDPDPFVAIKILNEEFRQHPQALVSLQRETSKTQTLAHPNIITVYDFDRDGATIYMTMELIRGRLLSEIINLPGFSGLSRDEAAAIVLQMAEGLAYAHQRGIVHSDFKPGNVIVSDDNRVKILDFGIARATKMADTTGDTFDAGELGAMTPGYASLEMLTGDPPDPADDVYALAVTVYQLLSGKHPFGRSTAGEAAAEGLHPQSLKGLHRREWKAVSKGLAFRREDRIADAARFLRTYRGPTRLARASVASIAVLSLSAAFFAWQSMQAPGPDVPFAELPADVQARFTRLIDTGDALPPELANESIMLFVEAYDLHPRNPIAESRLDAAVETYIDGYRWEAKSALDMSSDLTSVEAWQQANDYLARSGALARFHEQLSSAGQR